MGHEQFDQLSAAYALDALDPDEREVFELHLATCASCRQEVAELTESAAALAFAAAPAAPPARLRGQILERARAERSVVVPLRRRRLEGALAAGFAAAAAAAAVLAVWAGSLQNRLDSERSARLAVAQAAAVLGDPQASSRRLSGLNGRLVVDSRGRGVLVVSGLAAPPRGKTYEAWVVASGKPEPAGLFTNGSIVLLTRTVAAGALVAITVEPAGGSTRPTSTPFASSRPV